MTEFFVVAVLLSVVALGFALIPLLFPLLLPSSLNRQKTIPGRQRGEANIAAFEQRLAELERECELANYSAEERERLKADLQHRLLDDVDDKVDESNSDDSTLRLWPLVWVLILLLPTGAWLLYQKTGAQADLELIERLEAFQGVSNQAELVSSATQIIKNLKQQLAAKHDQPQHWMLLGRTQMRIQHYAEAEQSFKTLMDMAGEAPVVMGLYVQARYMAQGRTLDEVTQRVAERTLQLQPNNGTVLGLLGMANFEQQHYQQAINYWQRLLVGIDPQSADAKMIQQIVDQARAKLGDTELTSTVTNTAVAQIDDVTAGLSVSVSLGEGLNFADGATVFIYARAVNGPKMPLAVVKRPANQLPIKVTLTDAMAMMPTMKLSSFEQVEIVARVSSTGIANSAAGDLEGLVGPVASDSDGVVDVVIDKIL